MKAFNFFNGRFCCIGIYYIFLLLSPYSLFSQSSVIEKEFGKIENIRHVTDFKVVFIYDSMRVGGYGSEEMFISKKVSEYNEKKAGSGDKWLEDWINARINFYEPEFIEAISQNLKRKKITFGTNSGSKHTLIVRTKYIEPGFNTVLPGAIASLDAYSHFQFDFIENYEPGRLLLSLYVQNVRGRFPGIDIDPFSRIAESYSKAGNLLGSYLSPYF